MHDETGTPEIKREKIFIPEKFSISEIQGKYGLNRQAARRAKKKGSCEELYEKTNHH